jgi:hypothetical protein
MLVLLAVLAVAAIGWRVNGLAGAFVLTGALLGFLIVGLVVVGVLTLVGLFWAFANDSGQPFWKNKPDGKDEKQA